MKILTSEQIRELDKYTIENEPIESINLMERAAKALTRAITQVWGTTQKVIVFAGPGNNGGDALAVARMMGEQGYNVKTYLFNVTGKLSADCIKNKERLANVASQGDFIEVINEFDPPTLNKTTLLIDGLFGSGLSKPLSGGFASLVNYINQMPCKVASIDVPSGLMTEDNSHNSASTIVHADYTFTLQHRKLAFLFAENQAFVGKLRVLDIRLSTEYLEKLQTPYTIIEEADVRSMMKPRGDFWHKGMAGNALLVAGKYGMAGAAVLAAKACLRAGAGKVTVHVPQRNNDIMQIAVPEAIVSHDVDENMFTEAVAAEDFDAMGIGPGLGTDEITATAFVSQLRRTQAPIVIDADGLNILSAHQAWFQHLPEGTLITPHPLEFERLAGTHFTDGYEKLQKAMELAQLMGIYIILKGHYTAVCMPDGTVSFNPTGNAGMATAGSGDVLTGILTALLARGYSRHDAALVGVYLHGLAGDLAAQQLGMESVTASDIIAFLPEAFRQLTERNINTKQA